MTINLSHWDTPISLKSGSVGFSKPITFKVIVITAAVFLIWMSTSIYMLKHHFGFIYTVLFTIGFIMLSIISLKRGRTGEMGYKSFKPIYNYWVNYRKRFIKTRGIAEVKEVDKLKFEIPIENIDDETGKTEYVNGDVGALLKVIGNGSSALFVEEKERIITSFENLLQQMDLGVSITVESKQSKQDCSEQIRNLEDLKNKNSNPEIDAILSQRMDILQNDIQTKFKSTHQYMYLRAPDEERLNNILQVIMRQRGEGLLRYVEPITGDELYMRLKEFYSLS